MLVTFYLGTFLRTIAQEGSFSGSSEELSQRGKGGVRIHRNFVKKKKKQPKSHVVEQQKISVNHKKTDISSWWFFVLFSLWEDAGVWAYWNDSFDRHLNYREPVSSFFFHPSFPSGHAVKSGGGDQWLNGGQHSLLTGISGSILCW